MPESLYRSKVFSLYFQTQNIYTYNPLLPPCSYTLLQSVFWSDDLLQMSVAKTFVGVKKRMKRRNKLNQIFIGNFLRIFGLV